MIRGYFLAAGNARRAYVNGLVEFPGEGRLVSVAFLVDTGADRTVLALDDLARAGVSVDSRPAGAPSTGVGGTVRTRSIDVVVTLGSFSLATSVLVFVSGSKPALGPSLGPTIPSLLGQDLLQHFMLVMAPRQDIVLLLEPHEAAALTLP